MTDVYHTLFATICQQQVIVTAGGLAQGVSAKDFSLHTIHLIGTNATNRHIVA